LLEIKQSVINTFERVGIDYKSMIDSDEVVVVENRFGGGSCETTKLLAYLVHWVYKVSNDYEAGIYNVSVQDFDRIRYFILDEDSVVYNTCID